MKIKIKKIGKYDYPQFIKKGDWIDLRANETVTYNGPLADILRQKEGLKYRSVTFDGPIGIKLNIAAKLPNGFEANVVLRSSTPNQYGIIQANSYSVIDNSFCGDNNIWKLFVLPFKSGTIQEGARICQFRINLKQDATIWQKIKWFFCRKIEIEYVDNLGGEDRGDSGHTGKF